MYNKEFDNIEIPENIDLYIKKGLFAMKRNLKNIEEINL